MNEEQIEFRQQWSSTAGRLAATREAEHEIRRWASKAFSEEKDELAKVLRNLANHFVEKAQALSVQVQDFIAKDQNQQP